MHTQAALAAALAKRLTDHRRLIASTLAYVYRDRTAPVSLESLRTTYGDDLAEGLAEALITDNLDEPFVAHLQVDGLVLFPARRRARRVRAPHPAEPWDLDVVDERVDIDAERRFHDLAKFVRCLIYVDGKPSGSGVIVGRRLVLTACHVLDECWEDRGLGPVLRKASRVEVEPAAGGKHRARLVYYRYCHELDRRGAVPPSDCAECRRLSDVALLRAEKPLGELYGRIDLPRDPIPGQGVHLVTLLHFPNGVRNNWLSRGYVRRGPQDGLRQPHDIKTAPGSSGGPVFNHGYQFIGLHQGKFADPRKGRIVPFDCYFDDVDFCQEREKEDGPGTYLWSLDGTPRGDFVVGRRAFMEAVDEIVRGLYPALRGIWVRRHDVGEPIGVGFTCKLLRALLDRHETRHEVVSVPLSLKVKDVIGQTHRLALQGGPAPAVRAGVREDETTVPAHDEERAVTLADALEARAVRGGGTLWIVFENPPAGALNDTLIQLGQLVNAMLTRSALRVVVAGCETYRLVERLMVSPAEGASGPPGMVAEYVGGFTRDDLMTTTKALSDALHLGWSCDLRKSAAKRALNGRTGNGPFPLQAIEEVAAELRAAVLEEIG